MTIKYFTRNVYGRDLIYIEDADMAEKITALTGSRTVSSVQLNALAYLGHDLVRVLDPKLSFIYQHGATAHADNTF